MTNMPVLSFYIFLRFLLVSESSYHSRIASVYYGVYLDENFSPSKTPTYWKFQDNQTIHTPDASQALCINTFKHLDLCALGNGSQWSYEGGKMGLYAMSGADKYYMSLSDQGADVTLHQSGNSEKILLAPAPGDTDNPVVLKLGQALKSLREDLASVREKYNDILALKESMVNRSDSLMDEARASEEKYDGNVTLIAEKLAYLKSEEEDINTSMTQKLQKINDTEYSMKNSVFPTISKEINDIISKPDAFKEKLRMTDLEDYLNEQIAKVNKTLSGYLHKHRIAPVSMYDWLIILTTLLYILYFVDIIGRAAGFKCCGKRGAARIELEMESPSNIQPEYFLQDEDEASNFEFARTRESIKGKLQLKPVE